MQLKITTDYALRSLLYLAQEGECVNCAQIADATQIPRGYLQKLLIDLKNAGIVETYQGGNGGYALTRPPEQICLAEILEIFERSTRVNVCLESEYNGPCKEDCPIRKFCEGIQMYWTTIWKTPLLLICLKRTMLLTTMHPGSLTDTIQNMQ